MKAMQSLSTVVRVNRKYYAHSRGSSQDVARSIRSSELDDILPIVCITVNLQS